MNNRDDIDVFYMKMAYLMSERSTCLRRKVGSVIVRDKIVLSTGYNGVPKDLPHCQTCLRKELNIPSGQRHELCRASHAEGNAIAQAAMNGVNINGATIYCTTQPCLYCAKLIVNSGIKRLVYNEEYGDGMDDLTKEILSNIDVVKIKQ